MEQNYSEAPVLTEKDKMKEEIKNQCKKLLDKYFEGREYDREKVKSWKGYVLEELLDFFKKYYEGYGFCASTFIIKKGDLRITSTSILRSGTDSEVNYSIQNNSMFVELRIHFYKLYKPNLNYLDYFNEDLVVKMNDMLMNKLKGKTYTYEFAKDKVQEIVQELQDFLLIPKQKPTSFHICYILSQPIEYQFAYKVLNIKYAPLIASYSNDNLYGQLVLFIFDN